MNKPLLLSGGADGADFEWGRLAQQNDHDVCHFSFAGHRSKCHPSTLVILSDDELLIADPMLKEANKIMKRRFPGSNDHVNNLLRRNYYQIRDSESLYAITSFDYGMKPKGGTAWAIWMFILNRAEFPVYVYDQYTKQWFTYINREFSPISKPPQPSGIWTGIGTREINSAGTSAIHDLFQTI